MDEKLKAEILRVKLENKLLQDRLSDFEKRLKVIEDLNDTVANQLDDIAKQHRERHVKKKNGVEIDKKDKEQINDAWEMLKKINKK